MSFLKNKDTRTYVASGIFLLLVIMLMLFLTFIEIPSSNKDLIVSIISMLVWGTGVAMWNLFWAPDEELELVRKELAILQKSYNRLDSKYTTLKSEYDRITEMLVNRIELGKKEGKQ